LLIVPLIDVQRNILEFTFQQALMFSTTSNYNMTKDELAPKSAIGELVHGGHQLASSSFPSSEAS